jgi:hypothetical protein
MRRGSLFFISTNESLKRLPKPARLFIAIVGYLPTRYKNRPGFTNFQVLNQRVWLKFGDSN